MSNIPIGIVRDMPAEQYHADPSVSNSMLTTLSKSPAHFYALYLDESRPARESTAAMQAGTLAHTAILEPMQLARRYVTKPDGMSFATKEGKAWRDQQTLEIVQADAIDAALAQQAAVLSVPQLRQILSKGEAEVSLFWDDESTGLRCRARCDWLHWTGQNRVIAMDLKTTADITPEGVRRSIASYGYHRQHAHYCNGLRACGIEVEAFVFGFVSNSYPFLAAPYLLDDEAMEQGQQEIDELLNLYAWCKERNEWPFVDGYQIASLPNWAKRINEVEVGYAD